jgi:outer membrane protein assembly factor BamE (lipoprotein component of BamABCDE complex)
MRNASWIALLFVAIAGGAGAQSASIDAGMTKEQVVARLGKPISEHTSGESTYLYYSNGDEKKYGMHDMVALEHGKVVDAVFRSTARKYTGRSSSPNPIAREDAIAKGHGGHAPMKAAPMKKAEPPMKKAEPPMKKAEPMKKDAPAMKKAPPATKAVPPTKRLSEPKQGVDTRKIELMKKPSDTTKKATPVPTKKP